MIIDSPIISGSIVTSGSLDKFGNVAISGSLIVTGSIIGTALSATSASYAASASNAARATSASYAVTSTSASYAVAATSASFAATSTSASYAVNSTSASYAVSATSASFSSTASYLENYIPPFPFTGSAGISGSLVVNGNITAQTLVVQTITSSEDFVTGSTKFGSIISNTHQFTGSVTISGSLAVNDSNVIVSSQTSSMSVATASYWSGSILNATSASFASTASYWSGSINNALSASFADTSTSSSFATTSSFSLNVPVTASFANTATSSSFATTASFSLNVPVTSSYANNATSASFATTASYLTGYISPFPYAGSAIISGSLEVTGSAAVSNLQGTGVRYLVADASGSITAQSASAAIKQTQAFTSSANQTSFTIDNGYTTGLIDVFINGTKLAPGVEFTDTSGTVITLATGSNSGDLVEFVKYFPASGVTNNALRQQTTFTASAAQTVFSASYTPGLLDVFYNGSRLSNGEYTANNGTFFTLATGSVAGDILDVFVYSYQVGAFSGIGGVGVENQFAYFNTSNSITSSNAITISGANAIITGSLLGTASFATSASNATTASYVLTAQTASYVLNAQSASYVLNAQTSSYVLNAISSSFATRAITASYADSLTVAGTLTAQTLVVQTITSSIVYSSGSNIFGNSLGNTHLFTGSLSLTGSTATFAGNVGIGTTSPSQKLEVAGALKLSNNPTITNDNLAAYFWNQSGVGPTIAGAKFNVQVSGSTNAMFIDSNGYVGMGTSSPNAFLHLYTVASQNYPHLRLSDSSVSGNGGNVYISADKSGVGYNNLTMVAYSYLFKGGASANNYVTIDTSGNVGIGNTSPNTALSFANTTGNKIDFYNDGSVRYSAQINSGELRFYTTSTNDVISLYAGNTLGLINKNGNIGIGTTTPGFKLEVAGESIVKYNDAIFTVQGNSGFGLARIYGNSNAVELQLGAHQTSGIGSIGTYTNNDLMIKTNNTERFRIFSTNGYSNAYKYIGNLASTSLSSLSSAQIQRWYFDSQCNNTWRTLVASINQKHFFLRIWGSDAGTYNYGEYYFTMSFPGYGVSNNANYHYTSGGWNTGAFELTYTNNANDYYLQFRNTSYYSSSNVATYLFEITGA
jgi:hypothetical protein